MKRTDIQAKLIVTAQVLLNKEVAGDDTIKDEFHRKGARAFRALAKEMSFVESKVTFNPGGHAVAGDLYLQGMFADGTGIYMNLSQHCWDGGKLSCYCRSIKSMKDYTGGRNNWINDKDFQNVDRLIEILTDTAKEPARF